MRGADKGFSRGSGTYWSVEEALDRRREKQKRSAGDPLFKRTAQPWEGRDETCSGADPVLGTADPLGRAMPCWGQRGLSCALCFTAHLTFTHQMSEVALSKAVTTKNVSRHRQAAPFSFLASTSKHPLGKKSNHHPHQSA